MYNGIGLTTARGSGTNGFVQRNLSNLPTKQKRIEYKSEDELKRLEGEICRGPNPDILKHARKRQIELKCLEMRELMEEQNYTDEEIEQKVSKFRKMLFEKDAALEKVVLEKDEFGRPIARDTHEIAQAQVEKNRRFKEALGIPANYVDGSSLEKLSKKDEPKPEVSYGFIDEVDSDIDRPSADLFAVQEADRNARGRELVVYDSESDSDLESRKKTDKKEKKKKHKVKSEKRQHDSRDQEGKINHRSRSRSSSPGKHRHHRESRNEKSSKRHGDRSRSRSDSRGRSSNNRHVDDDSSRSESGNRSKHHKEHKRRSDRR